MKSTVKEHKLYFFRSIIVARVEQTEPGTSLVDVEKIREALAANGVGIIAGNAIMNTSIHIDNTNVPVDGTPHHTNVNDGQTTLVNNTIATAPSEEVVCIRFSTSKLYSENCKINHLSGIITLSCCL